MKRVLDADVRDILVRGEFVDGVYRLPPGQLERKMYERVNDALTSLGGKWNRGKKGHVFADDPRQQFTAMVDSGVVPPKNPLAFWFTPRAIVERMMELADEREECSASSLFLEPSAGLGAIAFPASQRFTNHEIHCVELDERRARSVADQGYRVWQSDFLTWDEAHEGGYDVVLMNPPFAVERDACEWMPHVRRAHELLAPHGVLVAVVPSGFNNRTDKKHTAFRQFAEHNYAYVEELGPDAFKESGTGVNAVLLRLRKVA